MRLDLRYPLGTLFTAFGLILVLYGAAFPGVSAPLTTVNVNLYSGLAMLAFGVLMLRLARRAESRPGPGAHP